MEHREDFDAQREAASHPSASGNALGDRGRANEEAWAARENARLLEELRKKGGAGSGKSCACKAPDATAGGDSSKCCQVTGDKSACQSGGACACTLPAKDGDAKPTPASTGKDSGCC